MTAMNRAYAAVGIKRSVSQNIFRMQRRDDGYMSSWIMSRRSSFVVSLSVCGTVAALAASPARTDDGVPGPVVPTTIVAPAVASLSSVSDAQPETAPQPPSTPEMPVIPAIPPTIPPAIPPTTGAVEPPPTASPEVAPASETVPPPVVQPPATVPPATPPTQTSGTDSVPGDTGNTTANNSDGITANPPAPPAQIVIWNWFWNCDTNQGIPTIPAPPAGATTIVLNWHWMCDSPPPPLDVVGITVCTSCNIVISVRVGSPGDTGDVTQSIIASTVAAAVNVANTIQEAFQAAIPSPPAQEAAVTVASIGLGPASTFRIDDGPVIAYAPEATSAADDLPRHGAPTSYGGRTPQASANDRAQNRVHAAGLTPPIDAPSDVRVAALQRWILQHPDLRRRVIVSRAPRRPLRAPPGSPPPTPLPIALTAGIAAPHGSGIGLVASLASGLALLFVYAIFSALRLPSAVPRARDAGANPHPPG